MLNISGATAQHLVARATRCPETVKPYVRPIERSHMLGAFAKLRKAALSFVVSVCLFVHMELLGSH